MIPTTLLEVANAVDGTLHADDRTAIVTSVVLDSRSVEPGATVRRRQGRAGGRPRVRGRGRRAARCGRRARPARAAGPVRRRAGSPGGAWPPGPFGPRPAAGVHGRRRDRVLGQDLHQGPARLRALVVDGDGRAGRVAEQRVRPAAHRAASDRADACPRCGDGRARHRPHRDPDPDRATTHRRRPQRRAPRTWGSTAPSRSSPRPRASSSRPCRQRRTAVSRCSTPTTRACAPWPRERRPASSSSASQQDAEVRAEDVRLLAGAHAAFTLVTPEGSAPVDLGYVGAHHVANALPPPPWPASSGWP